MHRYIGEAEDTADQIARMYLKASRYLTQQTDQIFERYKTKHGLSDAEARRLMETMRDKASLDELLSKLKSGEKTESRRELLKQLEAPAYQARIERLRQIQDQLNSLMEQVYLQELETSTSLYARLAREAYYHGVYNIQQRTGVALSFAHVSRKQIDRVVKSRWSGENYSSRIWKNTQALARDLKEELLINLVTGRTNREASRIIALKFGQGANAARRLVWTESSYLANEMNFEAYKACGIERYQYLATLDLKTCTKCCRQLDGKIFFLKDRKVGINFPPMHPWCRCTTVSVIDESLIQRMKRAARDPKTGKAILVPRSMTYEEWHRKYVENRDQEEVEKAGGSGIINPSDTKEVTDVHTVGKIDREIYKCITEEIVTDEVIITDERIQHIIERRGKEFYEKYGDKFINILQAPDFIFQDKQNTALVCKEFKVDNKYVNLALKLVVSTDNPDYKNSIITAVGESTKRFKQRLRNNEPLYKRE